MSGSIRVAQPSDATAIDTVHRAAWEPTYRGLIPDSVVDSMVASKGSQRWLERISNPLVDVFVALGRASVAEQAGVEAGSIRNDGVDGDFELGRSEGSADAPDEFDAGDRTEIPTNPTSPGLSQILGFICGGPTGSLRSDEPRPEDCALLHALYLHPGAMGRGLGTQLIDRLHQAMAERGCRFTALGVHPDNQRARIFYERRGYALWGEPFVHLFGSVELPTLEYRREL